MVLLHNTLGIGYFFSNNFPYLMSDIVGVKSKCKGKD